MVSTFDTKQQHQHIFQVQLSAWGAYYNPSRENTTGVTLLANIWLAGKEV